jgi:hypothetical protein
MFYQSYHHAQVTELLMGYLVCAMAWIKKLVQNQNTMRGDTFKIYLAVLKLRSNTWRI